MGGASKNALNNQSQISAEQTQLAREQYDDSKRYQAKMDELSAPLIDKEKALAGGDRNKALEAAMPTVSKITGGYDAAKTSILNNLPPGASRDRALANLEESRAVGTGTAMAGEVAKAPEILANMASGFGGFSLQEVGAALSGYGGAASTNKSVMDAQNQQQAAKLGLVGQVAGAAGNAIPKMSDRRLKVDIEPLPSALDKLAEIPLVSFRYAGHMDRRTHYGVIAQDVVKVLPDIVYVESGGGFMTVDYLELVAVALQAVKELQARVEVLESEKKAVASAR